MAEKIKITQVRSAIKRKQNQKDTLKALGLRKRGTSVVHDDTPVIAGMIERVKHLCHTEKVKGE
jgi:large subunit ribosomal protein L30